MRDFAAIDPMATILPEDLYLIWCEIRHPHVPKVADIEQLFKRMTPAQRKLAVSRAKALVKQAETVAACGKAVMSAG